MSNLAPFPQLGKDEFLSNYVSITLNPNVQICCWNVTWESLRQGDVIERADDKANAFSIAMGKAFEGHPTPSDILFGASRVYALHRHPQLAQAYDVELHLKRQKAWEQPKAFRVGFEFAYQTSAQGDRTQEHELLLNEVFKELASRHLGLSMSGPVFYDPRKTETDEANAEVRVVVKHGYIPRIQLRQVGWALVVEGKNEVRNESYNGWEYIKRFRGDPNPNALMKAQAFLTYRRSPPQKIIGIERSLHPSSPMPAIPPQELAERRAAYEKRLQEFRRAGRADPVWVDPPRPGETFLKYMARMYGDDSGGGEGSTIDSTQGGIRIRDIDPNQPMFKAVIRSREGPDKIIHLIPQLVRLDFGTKKKAVRSRLIDNITSETTYQKYQHISAFFSQYFEVRNPRTGVSAREVLTQWGINVGRNFLTCPYTVLPNVRVSLGREQVQVVAYNAQSTFWAPKLGNLDLHIPRPFGVMVVLLEGVQRVMALAQGERGPGLLDDVRQWASKRRLPLEILTRQLPPVSVDDDRNADAWLQALRSSPKKPGCVMCLVDNPVTVLYNRVIRFCSLNGIAVQFSVNGNHPRLASRILVSNLMLQLQAKLGAELWTVELNQRLFGPRHEKHVVIIGCDVSRDLMKRYLSNEVDPTDPRHERLLRKTWPAVIGFAAAAPVEGRQFFTRRKSYVLWDAKQEIAGPEARHATFNILHTYMQKHHHIDTVIFLRDGVGDQTFPQLKAEEVAAVRESMLAVAPQAKLIYIVVQKRIPTLLMGPNAANPTHGAVVESVITRDTQSFFVPTYDFFMQTTSSNKRSVRAVHYDIIYDELCPLPGQHAAPASSTKSPGQPLPSLNPAPPQELRAQQQAIKELLYQLCCVYPNYAGPIKAPCQCQMAHALSRKVADHILYRDGDEDRGYAVRWDNFKGGPEVPGLRPPPPNEVRLNPLFDMGMSEL